MDRPKKYRIAPGRRYIDYTAVAEIRRAILDGLDNDAAGRRCRVSAAVAAAVRCALTCERCGRLDPEVRPRGETAYLCHRCRHPELRLRPLPGLDFAAEVLG